MTTPIIPYFCDDTLTLYRGDALRVLSTLEGDSVDAIITDPPYSTGAFTLAGKQAPPAAKYQKSSAVRAYPPMFGDNKDQHSFYRWAVWWLSECWRVAREGSPILVFTDWRQLATISDAIQGAGFSMRGLVVWHKAGGMPLRGEFRRDCEYIVYGCKGKLIPSGSACLPGLYSYPVVASRKNHITAKPDALMADLMQVVSVGGTVLDPFLGGGATARAAQSTGRRCIGIELSHEYSERARDSLLQAR